MDHGYALYGALCRVLPALRDDAEAGVALVRGLYLGDGLLDLTPHLMSELPSLYSTGDPIFDAERR